MLQHPRRDRHHLLDSHRLQSLTNQSGITRFEFCRSPDGKPHFINGSTSGTHARFAALAVAAAASSHAELHRLCTRVHAAPTTSATSRAGIWTATATAQVLREGGAGAGAARVPTQLSVGRDLGCSAGGRRNQPLTRLLFCWLSLHPY